MKKLLILFCLPMVLFSYGCEGLEENLSDEEVIAGLKEALRIASDTSVTTANKTDGYAEDSRIRIPFPPDVDYVASSVNNFTILGAPVGREAVDAFVLKLNRAAENAAGEALPIFFDAITNITILNGMNILMGHDSAATEFLRTGTYENLRTTFQPDIEQSLSTVGAQNSWNTVSTYYNTITGQSVNTDLADYTTRRALNGLFTLLANEERDIRIDPAARVTDLLEKVFAEQD